ncbi:MAG: hypothetical protein ACR65T_16430 [Methylocystis sp.]|uniref:hypothetical protein n=1 Tax=Methylocystis sp. TaxID=1911079 RepID=UPI003DA49DB6
MSSLIAALREELSQLEAELGNDPRYRKAMHIRELLGEYETKSPATQKVVEKTSIPPPAADVHESKKAKVKREIDRLLRQEGPTHRNRILEVLIAKKLMGNEKDPMQSLAIYLSNFSDDFVSQGEGVWAIR